MRITASIALIVSLQLSAAAASAQIADKRSFFHPLGFWSNHGYVAQRQIYPRFHYAPRSTDADRLSEGGWLLHERNW